MDEFKTIEWIDGKVRMIDQTKLPLEEVYLICENHHCVAEAIRSMNIRGAPAIGVAAAMGIAIGARNSAAKTMAEFQNEMEKVCNELAVTRPTAVNLFWAIERMKRKLEIGKDMNLSELKKVIEDEAILMAKEDEEINRRMGAFGAALISDGDNILTHCNAGALATAGYGTALGVISAAHSQGKKIHVYVDETRPILQGARLTTWELMQEGIPMTLITDSTAGFFMFKKKINKVILGADRIAANGDTANKIGTYSVAVLAKENGIPFYVAVPMSTIDFKTESGEQIAIEERNPQEVTHILGKQIAPNGAIAANPAFDITPNRYISAIITEKGIAEPPFKESLKKLRGI